MNRHINTYIINFDQTFSTLFGSPKKNEKEVEKKNEVYVYYFYYAKRKK